MQKKAVYCCLLFLIDLRSAIKSNRSTALESDDPAKKCPFNGTDGEAQAVKKGLSSASLRITNDGPTILGTKTVFNVTFLSSPGSYLSYQWGTFIPYTWKNRKTYDYFQRLEVDWWKATGSKLVHFYIDVLHEDHPQKWIRVAQNSSAVEVIDYLSINVTLEQNHVSIIDSKLQTGLATFKAKIHDPSDYFKGLIIHYTWIYNDGTPVKVTTWNDVDHTFKKEGLFLIKISAVLNKNGKLYRGEISFYITVKGKITGYVLAWKSNDHHPTLPSKDISLSLGIVNFQFKLVDAYSLFSGAKFTYVWNYGDGTVIEDLGNATHVYEQTGNMVVSVGVYAKNHGNSYHSLIYKNISIREPIKDLNVKSHSKPKKGTAVQFNISCKGSAPVSFCWYVSRGSCELPSDVICSPTRLYHNCKNTINHTFRHTGGYCVNVTVINTVSFAEKSISVEVADEEPSNVKRKHSAVAAAAVLPIIAGLLLLVALFLGIKHKMQHRRRLARKSEVATFDFRSSQFSLHSVGGVSCCPFIVDCKGLCPSDDDLEDDHEMEERRTFLEEESVSTTPKRKISYYGSIHRILGQSQVKATQFEITEEDQSPFTPRKNLSKSV